MFRDRKVYVEKVVVLSSDTDQRVYIYRPVYEKERRFYAISSTADLQGIRICIANYFQQLPNGTTYWVVPLLYVLL
jgi:hypothetical protein